MQAAASSIASGAGYRGPIPAAPGHRRSPCQIPLLWLLLAVSISSGGRTQPPNAFEEGNEGAAAEQDLADPGVFLPSDRGRERELDRARRLIADERWSDAVVALDELLAFDRDAFVTAGNGMTRTSIRAAAAAEVAGLPRPGREAYHTLFDARAAKQLAAAIAADDHPAIVAVARRWLETPAGRQASILASVTLLESGQPLAASAWLERLAGLEDTADLEPALSALRAIARYQAGDETTAERLLAAASRRGRSNLRLAGRDLTLPADREGALPWLASHVGGSPRPPRAGSEWRQFGGGPTRVGVAAASRPLLVPRYRVPLVRHPEEARRLEQARRAAADAGEPLLPAGTPLAVGDRLVVQTPLGILAIDFESGRRVWLESAVNVAEVEPEGDEDGWRDGEAGKAVADRVFSDATSGNLASDGRLVFAVESPPAALGPGSVLGPRFGRGFAARGEAADAANTLSAYGLADGSVVWRLPAVPAPPDAETEPETETAPAARWHMGPPLVVGDDLFVLVEEGGEVQVEARAAADGSLRWSQPLATFDEGETLAPLEARSRRLAGLTPAFDEGVLVCPIGAGCVVAVDVSARSLLWAHAYQRPPIIDEVIGRRPGPEADEVAARRGGGPTPIITAGRVLLAPFDSNLLLCLGLRDGRPVWRHTRAAGTQIAGVTDGRVVTVGDASVEAFDLTTGRQQWTRSLGEGVRPSGRSLLTPHSVLVPCDTAAVIEIGLADGRILGRSTARGGRIPGNLVAHRGEVISRNVDSLDVFHQEAALEERIETARAGGADAPWAAYWRGQAAIEAGDVAAGLENLAVAAGASGFRIPPGDLDEAFVAAMRRDFAAAALTWATFPGHEARRAAPTVARMAVDGFLAAGDAASAWTSLEPLLTAAADAADGLGLFADPADPTLSITPDRWIQGRLARVSAAADASLRRRIDAACEAFMAAARATPDPVTRQRRLRVAGERLGGQPAAEAEDRGPTNSAAEAGSGGDEAGGWPLGHVQIRRARDHHEPAAGPRPHLLPVTLTGAHAGTRGLQAAIDLARERLLIRDGFGRPVTEPLPVEGLGNGIGMPFFNQVMPLELAVVGGTLFVRSIGGLVAYDLGADPAAGRGLWRRTEYGTEVDDRVRWGGAAAGRIARDGAVPLGLRIVEPADRPRGGGRGMTALPNGLVVPGPRSVAVLDPATGRVLWERHRLPPGLEWFIDEAFLCGCTVDGRGSVVCQLADGRLLHTTDVPHRRQRVAAQGRRFVAARPLDETAAVAARVRLELIDPVDREARPIGEFAGEARATATEDGRLAVLEPGGRLSVFELTDGSLVFATTLAEMPRRMERLHVHAWQDRYLVLAGASDEEPAADVTPLEQFLLSGGAAAPLSGVVWAVDRVHGRPLWPVPAVIERHCLHTAQPQGLPILVFCRLLQRRGGGQASLSMLCLDKRTGHAVFESDRVEPQAPIAFGCDVAGDPRQATITIGDARPLELVFTGWPMAPRPPFRSRGRPPRLDDGGFQE